jgi:apolipoprotein N-acyltransferase
MDEHGKHLSIIKPMVEGIAYGEVEICTESTLYTKIGNLFVYLCIAFIVLLFPIGIVVPRKRRF